MYKQVSPSRSSRWASEQIIYPMAGANDVPGDNSTPIFVRGKLVGRVIGDVFVKIVLKSRHFHRKRKSWCFDISSLRDATQAGTKWVEIHELEQGQTYRAAISTILTYGKELNEGHGQQIGLHRKYWSRGSEPVGEQLSLWGTS